MGERMVGFSAHAIILVGLSILYAIAFELVFLISDSMQRLTNLEFLYGSILFFPHGIRLLAAYLFGWRSIVYLLPVSLWYMNWDNSELTILSSIILSIGSLFVVVMAFELLQLLKFASHNYWEAPLHPVALLLAGSLGAMFNTIVHLGLGIIDGMREASGLFIGDILGMLSVLLVYVLISVAIRKVV